MIVGEFALELGEPLLEVLQRINNFFCGDNSAAAILTSDDSGLSVEIEPQPFVQPLQRNHIHGELLGKLSGVPLFEAIQTRLLNIDGLAHSLQLGLEKFCHLRRLAFADLAVFFDVQSGERVRNRGCAPRVEADIRDLQSDRRRASAAAVLARGAAQRVTRRYHSRESLPGAASPK